MLDNELKNMLNNLMQLYELSYQTIKPKVAYIIKNNIKDIRVLESVLEELLNIPTDKCYKLFTKLCNYIMPFNHELAIDYLSLYDELYGNNDQKTKKKSH